VILDLERFALQGQPAWRRLESLLDRLAARPARDLSAAEAEELEDLYHRACLDLRRLDRGVYSGDLYRYLEVLVARAYAEIYAPPRRFSWTWRTWGARLLAFFRYAPRVFRRHLRWFGLAVGLTLAGIALGGLAVTFDPAAVPVLLPASYLSNPAQRVSVEEHGLHRMTPTVETEFSAELITHNIQVSLLTLALGVTLGIGTGLLLFTNGLMLGAVAARYWQQGFGWFVAGWLLPHGAFEIPSILIAGQAGFLLAQLLAAGGREPRWRRLRERLPEVWTLFGALCCMLVWAGLMEAFFSQHHAPEIAYSTKAAVGLSELVLLTLYLSLVGRGTPYKEDA